MNAGRVKHHLFHNIENARNTFLIVGYCAPGTPGGALRDGAKQLRIFGEEKLVKAEVEMMDSFSAHAGRHELADFIDNQRNKLKKLFLVHGTLDKQEAFRDLLLENGFQGIEIPELGQEFEL